MRSPTKIGFGLAWLIVLGCGESSPDAHPQPTDELHAEAPLDVPEPALPTPAAATPAAPIDDGVEAPRPLPASWTFFPAVDPSAQAAVTEGADAHRVLETLAAGLAPFRWDSVDDWDNLGFVRIGLDPPLGFVTQGDGEVTAQPDGQTQLGCAGGYLEGARALLVPDLRMDQLRSCDDQVWETLGLPPKACTDETFGLRAIANTARVAHAAEALTGPGKAIHIEPSGPHDFDMLLPKGPLHLCTVSHESTTHDRLRLYHHLMIILRARGRRALAMFDTTGYRGMTLRRITPRRLVSYVRSALATNDTYRYDPGSTHVDCVEITRRR
ncbi:MAG: hypothetical protein K0V04_45890 [Deltaproteobacteria bacterium]|nr:hypothetical protein [Deltaproteobacteria bacterium]